MAEQDFFDAAEKDFYSAIESAKRFIDSDNYEEAIKDIRSAGLDADGLEENNPVRAQSIGVRDTLVMAQEAVGGSELEKKDSLRRAREHWETAGRKANREQDKEWVMGHRSEVQKKWRAKLNTIWETINDLQKVGSLASLRESEANLKTAKDEDPSDSAYNWDSKLSEVRKLMNGDNKPGGEVKAASRDYSDYMDIKSKIESLIQRGQLFDNVELLEEALTLTPKVVEDFKSNQELFAAALSLRNQVTLARDNLKNSKNMEVDGWEALKQGALLKARSCYQNAIINIPDASPRHKSITMTLKKVDSAVKLVEESARDEATGALDPAIRKLAEAKTLVGAPWVQIPWFDEALTRLDGRLKLKNLESKLETAEYNLNTDNLHSVLNLLQIVETQPGIDMSTVKNHWQRYRTLRDTIVSSILQQARDAEKNADLEQAIALIARVSPLYTQEEAAISSQCRELDAERSQLQKRLEEMGRLLQAGRGMLAEGNWEAAATFYRRALEVIPNRAEAKEGQDVAHGLQRAQLLLQNHPNRRQLKAAVKDMKQWSELATLGPLLAEKPHFSAQLKETEQALKKANGQIWKRVGVFGGAGVVVVAGIIVANIIINNGKNDGGTGGKFTPPPPPVAGCPVTPPAPSGINPARPLPVSDVKSYDPEKVEVYLLDNPGATRAFKNDPDGAYFRDKYIEMFNKDTSNRGLGKLQLDRQTDNGRELVFERGFIVWYKELCVVKGSSK